MTDLASRTPSEIDTELDKVEFETAKAYGVLQGLYASIEREQRIMRDYAMYPSYVEQGEKAIAKYEARIPAAQAAVEAAKLVEAPFHAEFKARGGWTRAYLVITNGQGHVHRSTSCSTCYATTQFVRVSTLSGMDEQAIVDAAGERACTVCYASAPVELRLDRKTTIFSEDEKRRQAEREERAAKRAAADAAKIIVINYKEFGRTFDKEFKTVRAVTNQIASDLQTLTWYGVTNFQEELHNIGQMRLALEAKGVEFDYDKALANARKKTVRQGGVAKY